MEAATPPAGHDLPHSCEAGAWLASQLEADQVDAALEAGLMRFVPCPACDSGVVGVVAQTQQRLLQAWAARDRHRSRNARLARQARARARPAVPAPGGAPTALPSAAAAALERARARARGSDIK